MSWETFSVEIEDVEEIVDTNPETYYARAEEALRIGDYSSAKDEADVAIKYGGGRKRYHLLRMKCFFDNEEYARALEYMNTHALWQYRNTQSYTGEEKYILFYMAAVCIKECHLNYENIGAIMITDDGRGMCPTIQSAISLYAGKKEIFLVGGSYNEELIIPDNVIIRGNECILSTIKGSIIVNGNNVVLSHLCVSQSSHNKKCDYSILINGEGASLEHIYCDRNDDFGIFIKNSNNAQINNLVVSKSRNGIGILDSDNIRVDNITISSPNFGIALQDVSNIHINNATASGISTCIHVKSGKNIEIKDSLLSKTQKGCYIENAGVTIKNTEISNCSFCAIESQCPISLIKCRINRNDVGVRCNNDAYIYKCNFSSNSIAINTYRNAKVRIENTTIRHSKFPFSAWQTSSIMLDNETQITGYDYLMEIGSKKSVYKNCVKQEQKTDSVVVLAKELGNEITKGIKEFLGF